MRAGVKFHPFHSVTDAGGNAAGRGGEQRIVAMIRILLRPSPSVSGVMNLIRDLTGVAYY